MKFALGRGTREWAPGPLNGRRRCSDPPLSCAAIRRTHAARPNWLHRGGGQTSGATEYPYTPLSDSEHEHRVGGPEAAFSV